MPFQTTLFLDSSFASGVSSNFTAYFNPPIELGVTKTYELIFGAHLRQHLVQLA